MNTCHLRIRDNSTQQFKRGKYIVYLSMYVRHVITFSRLGINRYYCCDCCNPVRGQLSRGTHFSLSPFAPENVVSRGGFGRPVPSKPDHSPYPG